MSDAVCPSCGGKARNEKRNFECTTLDGIHHIVRDVLMLVCLSGCKESFLDAEAAQIVSRAIKQNYSTQ